MDHIEQMWQRFAKEEQLTVHQLEQFKQYADLLIDWNKRMNLTAITDVEDVVAYHFKDSLVLGHACDMSRLNTVADVGSGAGFPGIPLKIRYPHITITLIEVLAKRRTFLQEAITALGLTGCILEERDWRTFLRAKHEAIDLVCARASLHTDELLRVFKPNCDLNNTQLVYWASEAWEPAKQEESLLKKVYCYGVGERQRKLVFFSI